MTRNTKESAKTKRKDVLVREPRVRCNLNEAAACPNHFDLNFQLKDVLLGRSYDIGQSKELGVLRLFKEKQHK